MATLERFAPTAWAPPWVRYQHLARYEWTRPLVVGKVVIDAACGVGYGSRMLAEAGAEHVNGFDLAADAIKTAREQSSSERVTFAEADVTGLPLADASADLYVCYETIEHVPNDGALLDEAVRVLRPGGTFVVSTPNRVLTNPGITLTDRPFNMHHVREYTQPELERILLDRFRRVTWYGQTFFAPRWGRWLGRLAGVSRGLAVRSHQMRKLFGYPWERQERHVPQALPGPGEPEFLIALCER
jgi:SAM-dependent methyltransferase